MTDNKIKFKTVPSPFTEKILRVLPQKYTAAYLRLSEYERLKLTEIRIRANRPCSFTVENRNIPMVADNGILISEFEEIELILEKLCEGSVYSFADTIKNGYLPYCGTRIGVCGVGSCVDEEYIGQKNITSISIRIPGFIPNAADDFLSVALCKGIENSMGVLCVSPPNCGKTTFLRALAQGLSDIYSDFAMRVCIIDEREEIYNRSFFENCICDVISGVPKFLSAQNAVRSMSPQVLVFDEIRNEEESEMLCRAYSGGIYVAASVHGNRINDVMSKKYIRLAVENGVFSTLYFINRNGCKIQGRIVNINNLGETL